MVGYKGDLVTLDLLVAWVNNVYTQQIPSWNSQRTYDVMGLPVDRGPSGPPRFIYNMRQLRQETSCD